ncbi:hypothetical protein EON80_23890 [bacterium]|nr:MAG: hypothetical protein EON80_23890 [bacterium]
MKEKRPTKTRPEDYSTLKVLLPIFIVMVLGLYIFSRHASSKITFAAALMSFVTFTMGAYGWVDYKKGDFKWYLDGVVALIVILICLALCVSRLR